MINEKINTEYCGLFSENLNKPTIILYTLYTVMYRLKLFNKFGNNNDEEPINLSIKHNHVTSPFRVN